MYFCVFHACFECEAGQRHKRDHSQNFHYLLSLLRSVHYSIGIPNTPVFVKCLGHSFLFVANYLTVQNSNMYKLVVPLQARCGPEGSRRFKLPDFHDIRHMKVVRPSASCTGRLYPQECSWYSFSVGAESTPGPRCGRKENTGVLINP
jgi:hypothetical protein